MVVSSDFRLSKLTPFQSGEIECKKEHREKSVCCENGIVYEIPLKCGFKNVGETSHFISDILNEHKINVKKNAQISEIGKHLHNCKTCTVLWSEMEIIPKERSDVKRVVMLCG